MGLATSARAKDCPLRVILNNWDRARSARRPARYQSGCRNPLGGRTRHFPDARRAHFVATVLTPGRAGAVATSTIDETVNFYGEPFDRFGQLEKFGRELFYKRCLCDWVIFRVMQLAEGRSNLVRNPDDCHAREPTDWSAPPTGATRPVGWVSGWVGGWAIDKTSSSRAGTARLDTRFPRY